MIRLTRYSLCLSPPSHLYLTDQCTTMKHWNHEIGGQQICMFGTLYTHLSHFQVAAVMLAVLQIVIRSFSTLLDPIIFQ